MSGGLEFSLTPMAAALLALFSGLLTIPAATFFIQVLTARLPAIFSGVRPISRLAAHRLAAHRLAGHRLAAQNPRPSLAVIMPAHDEGRVIKDSLRSILPQLRPGERLLVVADNCTDNTAAIAHALGAEVVIRDAPQQRGKGYALDFGLKCLAGNLPEVVIFIDADCLVAPGALETLARRVVESGRPVQACFRMQPGQRSGTAAKLAAFAWVVRNVVRPLGAARLGLPCQLMGTGMAIPRRLVSGLALANGHIVEDLQLGIDLALAGQPPLFCPAAEVVSRFPDDEEAAATQRTRWEHGHLGMIQTGVPRLLSTAMRRHDARLLGMALDLAVPPLALLTLLAGGLALAGLVAAMPLALLPFGLIALGVLIAWAGWGRALVTPGDLLAALPYALGKIPIYLRFLIKREQQWVKTRRD